MLSLCVGIDYSCKDKEDVYYVGPEKFTLFLIESRKLVGIPYDNIADFLGIEKVS